MRITCPSCEANYDVPDGAIPADGREVQCSECGHVWTQKPDKPGPDIPPPPRPTPVPKPTRASLAPEPSRASPAPEPTRAALDPEVARILREEAEFEARARAAQAGPVIEEAEVEDIPAPADPVESAPIVKPGPPRFSQGFLVGLLLVGACAAIYANAPDLSAAVPEAAPALDTYVNGVNGAAVWLDDTVGPLLDDQGLR
jgi:predicted Zn finger-like uncharacterized protein